MFGYFTKPEEYAPLRESERDSDVSSAVPNYPKQSRVAPLLAIVCVLCTVANGLMVFSAPGARCSIADKPITRDEMRYLRRPSQYIGLDQVARPSPPIPLQFDNYPIVVASVDSVQQNRVLDDDSRRYLGHSGTVSSENRRILVTDTVSTIVQFRAIDFGMESCELHVNLPAALPDSTSFVGHSVMLSLYRLDASVTIDTKTLSYKTRPNRVVKIDDIPLGAGNVSVWHHKFSCTTEEVLSFELARSSFDSDYDCHVEWWQDKAGTDDGPGIFITQYSTI